VLDEEPVILADRGGPDRIFDQVLIDPGKGVVLVRDQHIPVVEQIRARLAQQRLRQGLPGESGHDVVTASVKELLALRGLKSLFEVRLTNAKVRKPSNLSLLSGILSRSAVY
jgi:hypothetical protein